MILTPYQRADAYESAFPEFARAGSSFVRGRGADGSEKIYATFFGGQSYVAAKGDDPRTGEPYYGKFPHGFLRRVFSMFPDAQHVLHLFSGSLTSEQVIQAVRDVRGVGKGTMVDGVASPIPLPIQVRFDLRPEMKPDVIGDAERLSYCSLFRATEAEEPRALLDLIIADPPYSQSDMEKYIPGAKLPSRKKWVSECAKVLRPGGCLVVLDEVLPMFKKTEFKLFGTAVWFRSTNHRIRAIMMFERV